MNFPGTNPDSAPRFLADVMLGRLVRWLRALGYDTVYDRAMDDPALADLARREGRILLTRDVELTRRKQLRTLRIEDDQVMAQLQQVTREFQLNDAHAFTRCVECNAELQVIQEADAKLLVPPYVFKTQTRFLRCPGCGKVYWRGTHWTHMRGILQALENRDETDQDPLSRGRQIFCQE